MFCSPRVSLARPDRAAGTSSLAVPHAQGTPPMLARPYPMRLVQFVAFIQLVGVIFFIVGCFGLSSNSEVCFSLCFLIGATTAPSLHHHCTVTASTMYRHTAEKATPTYALRSIHSSDCSVASFAVQRWLALVAAARISHSVVILQCYEQTTSVLLCLQPAQLAAAQ